MLQPLNSTLGSHSSSNDGGVVDDAVSGMGGHLSMNVHLAQAKSLLKIFLN